MHKISESGSARENLKIERNNKNEKAGCDVDWFVVI